MYQQHPLSAAFPAMTPEDFQALKDSIVEIGVQNPITLFEGMVIDGWHRYTAANELGMACPEEQLGDVDPRDFVLALNKNRRHSTQAQMAMATTAVYAWKPLGTNQHTGSALSAEAPKSTRELAAAAGVGVRSIEQAKAVQQKAAPEVQAAVKRGEIGLPKAAAIAKLPMDEQAAAIHQPTPKQAAVEEPEDDGPGADEMAANAAAEAADRAAFNKLMDADDKLAAAVAEVQRLNAELAAVKVARDGYMNQNAELIRTIKSLQRRLDRAERAPA